tara:strand:- start:670 stop:1212 length:543 start_codon:yes stop_codon:yes gene_type:complete
MRKIYLIRHAESEANAAMDLDNPTYYYDAKITKRGEDQAAKARENLKNIEFDTYICSPLTRTIQTFSIIFPNKKPLIQPLIREQLYHSCDVGRQPNILKKEFPLFDFSRLNQYWWNNDKPINEKKIVKENFNDIKIRLEKFKSWLIMNDSSTIALVSHGTFLSQITGYLLENCEHFIWKY